jgi:hypothetical protein
MLGMVEVDEGDLLPAEEDLAIARCDSKSYIFESDGNILVILI